MPVEGQQMTIMRVSSRNAQARAEGAFSHILVHCNCGHQFTARQEGYSELGALLGTFYQAIGNVTVECPACEASELFPNRALVSVIE